MVHTNDRFLVPFFPLTKQPGFLVKESRAVAYINIQKIMKNSSCAYGTLILNG